MADNALSRAGGLDASIYSGLTPQPNALDAYGKTAVVARQLQALQADQFDLAQKRLGALNNSFSSVVTNPTQDNVMRRAAELKALGVSDDEINRGLNEYASTGWSPEGIKGVALGHLSQVSSVQERLQQAGMAAPTYLNNGATNIPVSAGSGAAQGMKVTGGPAIDNQLSPGEASSIVTMPSPNNPAVSVTATKRQALGALGDTSTLPPARPGTVSFLPTQGGASGGVTGPGPTLGGDLDAYTKDKTNATAKMTAVQPLMKAVPLLEALGPSGVGPGTKAWNDAKSFLVSAGVLDANKTNVDVRDELNKYLNQYVAKSGIAQRSDMGGLMAERSSPNPETSQKATLELARSAIASDRMEAARPLAFPGGDANPTGYGTHSAKFMQTQDPRAYRIDLLPSQDRVALIKSMQDKIKANPNDPEAVRFWNSMAAAHKGQVIAPASAANASP